MESIFDRVKETCTVTGTANIVLGGVLSTDFAAYASRYADGAIVPYCVIESVTNYEVGLGVFNSTTGEIARTAEGVSASSNADGLVSFTAGDKEVFASLAGGTITSMSKGLDTGKINAALLHILRVEDNSLAPQLMVDGFVDGFVDESGVDPSSANFAWDEVGSFYSNEVAIEDIINADVTYEGFKDVSAQATQPRGVFLGDSGFKMYVTESITDTIIQYTLTTAWDVTGTVTHNGSYSVTAQDATPICPFFNPGGTKMYVVGRDAQVILQYTLTTPWDVTGTVTYNGSYSVAAQGNSPQGLYFSLDGTKMYHSGQTNDKVFQYTLTTPWDVTGTVAYNGFHDIAAQDGEPEGVFLSDSGLKMYLIGKVGDNLYQYDLATAWDITTGVTYDGFYDMSAQVTNAVGLFISPGGLKFYSVDWNTHYVYQYGVTATALAATLITEPRAAQQQPKYALIVAVQEDIGAVVINTDLIASASRDGGVTYTSVSLVLKGTTTEGRNIYAGTASFLNNPVGSSCVCKLETTTTALKLHAVSAQWE